MKSLISFLQNEFNLPERLVPGIVEYYQIEHLTKDEFLIEQGTK